MSDTIAVVFAADAKDEAYAMGFERFEASNAADAVGTRRDPDDDIAEVLDGYQSSHDYEGPGGVLCQLRAMAGFGDAGHGTYQRGRQVALVEEGDEDDRPIEAVKLQAHHFYDELVDLFAHGAYDALHPDRERGDGNC